MHPPFLGREDPWSCGSSKLLAQAPNPRERALPPRLTNPADEVSLALLQGFQDSLASACLQDRRLTTAGPGITCSAHALSVSAETKGVGRHVVCSHHQLLLDKEEKELAMRPILPKDVPIGRRTLSHGSRQGQTPSQKVPSNISCKILVPTSLQATAVLTTFRFEPMASPNRFSPGTVMLFPRL